jgi:hypothetical protein
MVSKQLRSDHGKLYECVCCGLQFHVKEDARRHEANCEEARPVFAQ